MTVFLIGVSHSLPPSTSVSVGTSFVPEGQVIVPPRPPSSHQRYLNSRTVYHLCHPAIHRTTRCSLVFHCEQWNRVALHSIQEASYGQRYRGTETLDGRLECFVGTWARAKKITVDFPFGFYLTKSISGKMYLILCFILKINLKIRSSIIHLSFLRILS